MQDRSEKRESQSQAETAENVTVDIDSPEITLESLQKSDGKDATQSIIDSVVESMPEPSEFSKEISDENIDSETENETASESSQKSGAIPPPISTTPFESTSSSDETTAIFDSAGTRFDREKHCIDDNGFPRRTKLGRFRLRKGAVNSTPAGTSVDIHAATAAAFAVVTTVELTGACIGGDEWKAEQNEHDLMVNAWRDYFIASGGMTIPPWIGVAIATSAYAAPRLTQPKTSTRLGRMWNFTVKAGMKLWNIL